jgi:hypothetical protein
MDLPRMFTALLTRFADMADVISRRRWGTRWSRTGASLGLAGLLLLADPSPAPAQPPGSKAQPPGKASQEKGATAADADKDEAPGAPDVNPGAPVADPVQTRRVSPIEVFKDPNAEAILDIGNLRPLPPAPFNDADLNQVKEWARNPNLQADRTLIDRVVRGLAARLTDRKSIQSLLEGPPQEAPRADTAKKGAAVKKPQGDGGKFIQNATTDLLEPIYLARGVKNDGFLKDYRRSLYISLPPLLKNHLVPRVQAMIVLGEAATPTPEALQLFQSEITNRSQTLWVKLWALEGITNIKRFGGRFTADLESKAAKTVADFLEKKDIPWPIQLRGLETLGALRQGFLPVQPDRAHMANSAMAFLADTDARLEVRAEAARTLGLMQVNAVPNYNFRLVAHAAGMLAADVASQINEQYSDSPPRAVNPTKARYLTALLVGPAYQCFDGVEGQSNSGILQTGRADVEALKYVQKVFDLIRPMAQASVDLLNAPTQTYKAKKKTLADRTAALRSFLTQNPPPSRKLVPTGQDFGAAVAAAVAQPGAPGPAMAGLRRGR